MGLLVTHLEFTDFRSYGRLELEPGPELTILVGPNATGKTNIIEGIELLTAAESFKRPAWSDVVRWGADEARLEMRAEGDGRVLDTVMYATCSGRRSYKVNGKTRKRVSEVAGIVPCVVFTPDDLRIVKDAAEKRRAAVDSVGDQLSPAYRGARVEFERILKHRNSLLREEMRDEEMLTLWTSRLAESGVAFSGHRRRLFERISTKMSEVYCTLSGGESLVASYEPSWEGRAGTEGEPRDLMDRAIELRGREERARSTTLVGPHRDEISFAVDGRSARTFASQGQQRTIALAWKLAEVGVITEIGGQPPVLLLDDVMSELDEARRHALARFVGDAAQTFVTTTNIGYFEKELVDRALVVELA
ncbi:MAG: DNA replication/repair protein RecF [Coriobacteriia bacterium]|nr:DNA replication/repair protein RecF [Coriobacteriia bacterium]